ncbi:hypothetical protein EK21DRAFT_74067, partial [Setomelanomma holmii]
SPLLRLPAELKNKVDGYALTENARSYTFLTLADRSIPPCNDSGILVDARNHPNRLALLATCRQLHAETRSLPFSLHVFRFASLWVFERSTLRLLPFQRAAITKIVVDDRV